MKSRRVAVAFVCLLWCCVPGAQAWWGSGHQRITEGAVTHLPPTLGAYFRANRPSLKGYSGQEPPGQHYIDIDAYPEFDESDPYSVSRDIDDLIALHGQTFVEQNGTAPWTVDDYVQTLSTLMATATTAEDWSNLLETAGQLAHYVEDLHNPLHLTTNYNGQQTGNDGIHARYEGEMISRHMDDLTIIPAPGTCVHLPSPVDNIFDGIYAHYPFVDTILAADTLHSGNPPTYDETYYAGMWTATGTFTQGLLQEASEAVASAWYTAWINAGSPQPIYPPGNGDFDLDGDVDLGDLAGLQTCFTPAGQGPVAAGCAALDANADTDVDLTDWATVGTLLTGPWGTTIAQVRQAAPGAEVTVGRAVISSTTDLVNDYWLGDFYIQDDTGGLRVFAHRYTIESLLSQVGLGDQIRLVGTLDESGGVLELVEFFDLLGTFGSPGAPEPIAATALDFQNGSPTAESLESMLVLLPSAQFQQGGNFRGETRYTVTTSNGDVTVWIATDDLDMVGQSIPSGPTDLVGILSQSDDTPPFDGGYELWLCSLAP